MLKNLIIAAVMLVMPLPALALSTDEVIRLKQAGVSDEVIQKMIEQDNAPRDGSGVWQTDDQIIYQSAPRDRSAQDNYWHERWKEERSMDAVGNVIIDGRRPLPGPPPGAPPRSVGRP